MHVPLTQTKHCVILVAACLGWLPMTSDAVAQWGNPNWQGNRWQLGVSVQNTNTGVVLTQVSPNGAAANGGLTIGDRILAVGGHQVGYVDGKLVDLGDEINLHISPNGQVNLLILTARGVLQEGALTLISSGSAIEGAAYFPGGEPLSSQAVMNVRMLDTTYNHWNGVEVYRWSVQRVDRSPFGFRLTFGVDQIARGHNYVLEAEIVDRGRVLYRTTQATAVDPGKGRVALSLTPVSLVSRPVLYDQVNNWYQSYLGRQPTEQELHSWQSHINRGQPVSDVQSYLLGSTEYYSRYRDDNDQYLIGVYRSLYGVDPNPQTLATMRQQYDQSNGIRSQFVQQMMQGTQP